MRIAIHVLAAGLSAAVVGLAPLPLSDGAKLFISYGLALLSAMVTAYLGLTSTGRTKPRLHRVKS